MAAAVRKPRRTSAQERRRSEITGLVGVLLAAALPIYLWHDVIADVASVPGFDWQILIGWTPWALMALGVLCGIPVAVEKVRNRNRRFYRPSSGAWVGWGISLYVMGFGLATQVAQLHDLHG